MRHRRAGFSVIELIVVVSIMAILAGMLISGVMASKDRQHRENTKALLKKLDQAVMQQWSQALKEARATQVPSNLLLAVGPTPSPDPLRRQKIAQAIWVKLVMRAEFPMTFAEVQNPWAGFPAAPAPNAVLQAQAYYLKGLNGLAAANNPATESAPCSTSRSRSRAAPPPVGTTSTASAPTPSATRTATASTRSSTPTAGRSASSAGAPATPAWMR